MKLKKEWGELPSKPPMNTEVKSTQHPNAAINESNPDSKWKWEWEPDEDSEEILSDDWNSDLDEPSEDEKIKTSWKKWKVVEDSSSESDYEF